MLSSYYYRSPWFAHPFNTACSSGLSFSKRCRKAEKISEKDNKDDHEYGTASVWGTKREGTKQSEKETIKWWGGFIEVDEITKGIERGDQQHAPGRGMGHCQMKVVGGRFCWQHRRLFYRRAVLGLWTPARRHHGCSEFAWTQRAQEKLMEKSFAEDYRMLGMYLVAGPCIFAVFLYMVYTSLQSLLETRHRLKESFCSYVLKSCFKLKKKAELFFWPRISGSWSAIWKQKPTVKSQTC